MRSAKVTQKSRDSQNRRSESHAPKSHAESHAKSRGNPDRRVYAGQKVTQKVTRKSRPVSHVSHCPYKGQGTDYANAMEPQGGITTPVNQRTQP